MAYAKQRKQFGVPIASFQGIQSMLADMAINTNVIRCMCEEIITQMENHYIEKNSRNIDIQFMPFAIQLHQL